MKQPIAKIFGLTISLGLLLSSHVLAQNADEKASRVVEAEAVRLEQLQAAGGEAVILLTNESSESDTAKFGKVLSEVGTIYFEANHDLAFRLTSTALRRLMTLPISRVLLEDWYIVGLLKLGVAVVTKADLDLIHDTGNTIRLSITAIALIADDPVVQQMTRKLLTDREAAFAIPDILRQFVHLATVGNNEIALRDGSLMIADEIINRLRDGRTDRMEVPVLTSIFARMGNTNGQRALLYVMANVPIEYVDIVGGLSVESEAFRFDPVLYLEAILIVEQRLAKGDKGLKNLKGYFESRLTQWIKEGSYLENYWMELFQSSLGESRRAIRIDVDTLRVRALIREFILNIEISDEALMLTTTQSIEAVIRKALTASGESAARSPGRDAFFLMWGHQLVGRLSEARERYIIDRLVILESLAARHDPKHDRFIAGIAIEVMEMILIAATAAAHEKVDSALLPTVNETLLRLFGVDWTARLCRHLQQKLGIRDLAEPSESERFKPLHELYQLTTKPRAIDPATACEVSRRVFPESTPHNRPLGLRDFRRLMK